MKSITRPISDHVTRLNRGAEKHWAVGGSIYLTLAECGHEQSRKLSQGLPKTGRVRCHECEQLRDGVRMRTGPREGPWIQYGWDSATSLPTRTEIPAKNAVTTESTPPALTEVARDQTVQQSPLDR